ncbi:MAG: hypothetical protein ND866_20460 [Pyrinomonadaceae bacterium]|nr:hypothetical protein [Pyrinomonadaceae bacterium]
MTDEAHIIDIDTILLNGLDRLPPGELALRIEAEVQRVLSGAGLSEAAGIGGLERRVAAEVGDTVARSVEGRD